MDSSPPILDARLADQWFGEGDVTDQELDRNMISALRHDVGPRLNVLQTTADRIDPGKAVNELHRLRGAVASFGFTASARHLENLELNWITLQPAGRLAALEAAYSTFAAGVGELLRRFPHLAEP